MTFGPLAIRVATGVIVIINGWPKIIHFQQTPGYFMMIGVPQELVILIGLLEVIGGILLIIGLLTRITSLLFVAEMIGAFIIINVSKVVVLPKGYELGLLSIPILMMVISISLVSTGPGRISIEWDVLKRELIPNGKEILSKLRDKCNDRFSLELLLHRTI